VLVAGALQPDHDRRGPPIQIGETHPEHPVPAVVGAPVPDPLPAAGQHRQQRPVPRRGRPVDQPRHDRRVEIAGQLPGFAAPQLGPPPGRGVTPARPAVGRAHRRGRRDTARPVGPHPPAEVVVAGAEVGEERRQHAQPVIHRARRADAARTGQPRPQVNHGRPRRRPGRRWPPPVGERGDVVLHVPPGHPVQPPVAGDQPAGEVRQPQPVGPGRVRPPAPGGQVVEEPLDLRFRYPRTPHSRPPLPARAPTDSAHHHRELTANLQTRHRPDRQEPPPRDARGRAP